MKRFIIYIIFSPLYSFHFQTPRDVQGIAEGRGGIRVRRTAGKRRSWRRRRRRLNTLTHARHAALLPIDCARNVGCWRERPKQRCAAGSLLTKWALGSGGSMAPSSRWFVPERMALSDVPYRASRVDVSCSGTGCACDAACKTGLGSTGT